MRTVRITAKTIEAAVAEGLKQLGISREEAVVHVVEQPSSGLFGLIHKKMAVVDISAPDEEVPAEEAKKFLASVFKGMHLDVTMECLMNEERILLNLHGEGLGILIGKHGQTLDALQYLTNLAAGKAFHHHYFVLLDVENYRERRKDTLEALARRLAAKVKRTGEPVKLEPMAAGERRIIHLALQDDGAVTTESEGEAPHRYVVIKRND